MLRWLVPAALALFAAADLALSYAAAMLARYGSWSDPESPDSPDSPDPPDPPDPGPAGAVGPAWWRWLLAVVFGGPAPAPGPQLVAVLLRPCAVLLALQLYRRAFAATAVAKWLRLLLQQPPAGAAAAAGGAAAAGASAAATATARATAHGAKRHRDRLAEQRTTAWFVKRWLVRSGGGCGFFGSRGVAWMRCWGVELQQRHARAPCHLAGDPDAPP